MSVAQAWFFCDVFGGQESLREILSRGFLRVLRKMRREIGAEDYREVNAILSSPQELNTDRISSLGLFLEVNLDELVEFPVLSEKEKRIWRSRLESVGCLGLVGIPLSDPHNFEITLLSAAIDEFGS